MKKTVLFSLAACACLGADTQLEALKAQLREQSQMIRQLMQRLEVLEKEQSGYSESAAADPYAAYSSPKATTPNASFSQQAYLPDIALILNSSAVGRNIDNEAYGGYEIPGFVDADPNRDIPYNADRGFNFNYAEVAMYSAVDPYFDAFAIFHMSEDEFEVDEGYVSTRDLPYGLKIKAGKFKSAFGRYNEKHHHAWEFSEQALVYQAFFGPEGLSDPGVQLQWVAPTQSYLMIGVEAMQGSNEQSFGYEKSNSVYNTYLKSSVDIGEATSILAGASFLHGQNEFGDTNIYGVDLTLQHQLSSYRALTWQSEYLYRDMHQELRTARQDGLYSQVVYKYDQNYATGFRYDTLLKNNLGEDNLDMYTVMLEYKPFEFSRLRLEYSLDRSKYYNAKQKDVKQLMLELNIAVGAHSAHSY